MESPRSSVDNEQRGGESVCMTTFVALLPSHWFEADNGVPYLEYEKAINALRSASARVVYPVNELPIQEGLATIDQEGIHGSISSEATQAKE